MVQMQSGTYSARIGDMVELSVMGYPEFHTSSAVDESGDIMVPSVGQIHAAGLTKPQIAEAARKKLSTIVRGEPEITIGLFSPASQKITVLGAVTKQDNITATGEMTVLQALSSAGGPTPESDLSHVRIIHNGNTADVSDIDLSSYLETGNREGLPLVESGDVIYVPKKENEIGRAHV